MFGGREQQDAVRGLDPQVASPQCPLGRGGALASAEDRLERLESLMGRVLDQIRAMRAELRQTRSVGQ